FYRGGPAITSKTSMGAHSGPWHAPCDEGYRNAAMRPRDGRPFDREENDTGDSHEDDSTNLRRIRRRLATSTTGDHLRPGDVQRVERGSATCTAPNPSLPDFLKLIQSLVTSQQAVSSRTRGAAATRDEHHVLLLTGMENQRVYIETLANQNPARGVSI